MSPFLGNSGTKLYKLEDENMVSKFIEKGANKENMWEHGNIGQFWKGTREQGPPPPPIVIKLDFITMKYCRFSKNPQKFEMNLMILFLGLN